MKHHGRILLAGSVMTALAIAVHAEHSTGSGAEVSRLSEAGEFEAKLGATRVADQRKNAERRLRPSALGADQRRIHEAQVWLRSAWLGAVADHIDTGMDHALLTSLDVERRSDEPGARADVLDGLKYTYFDGFQTYDLGMLAGQNANWPTGGWSVGNTLFPVVVDTALETSLSPHDPDSANLRNPRNPFAPDPYPEGTNAREQALKDSRVNVADMSPGTQQQWTLYTDELYLPRIGSPVITGIDLYYNNLETLTSFDVLAQVAGSITSRLLDAGFWENSFFTSETDGVLDRPAVLGKRPGTLIGEFFALPLQPRDSSGAPALGLDRFRTQTGGWFTLAFAITTEGTTVWVRNDLTDGSGPQGVVIEDPDPDDPLFASGWCRVYPGRPADHMGGNVWTGYGIAVNEFNQQAVQYPHSLLPLAIDCIRERWFGTVGIPADTSEWDPQGRYFDNWFVIGEPFETPPVPKRRLPYKDDMELYPPGAAVGFIEFIESPATGRAAVAFGEYLGITVNASDSPGSHGDVSNQSIMQRNISGSDIARSEFGFRTPVGDHRPIAARGAPVAASAQIRMTSADTTRGMEVVDEGSETISEFLMMGAVDPVMGTIVDRFFIRRPNPFFDAGAPSSAATRIFGAPDTSQNAPFLNIPTEAPVSPLTDAGGPATPFFHTELTLSGDGTGYWSVNGQRLTFDLSGFSPAEQMVLIADFESAQMAADEPVGPPYSRFFTELFSLDHIRFWSGNQPMGIDDRIFVDDICIDGSPLMPDPGPMYELPFCEEFSGYSIDRPIAGHGHTPFAFVNTSGAEGMPIRQRAMLVTEDDAIADPSAQWCSYTIDELFDGDPGWGLSVGDTLYVRTPPVAGFVCPEREIILGLSNLTLIDADPDGLEPCPVRVGPPSDVVGDGGAADVRASFTRYAQDALFCRYEITQLEAEIDDASGGAPFPIPDELFVGAVLAVSNPFEDDCIGVFNFSGDSVDFNMTMLLFSDGDCPFARGRVRLLKPESASRTNATECPPGPAEDDDVRGYGVVTTPSPLWGGFFSTTTGGIVRHAQDEMDLVTMSSIDSAGERGSVLAYFNSGAVAPLGVTGGMGSQSTSSQNSINVPTIVAAEETPEATELTARICWDYYIQDNNTRIIAQVNGPRFDEKGELASSAPVIRVRYGGPIQSGVADQLVSSDTEISIQIEIPGMFGQPAQPGWSGTGVSRPTGEWFTSCVEVDSVGDWSLEVDGAPIAAGASITAPMSGLTVPMGVANLQFRSGFDEGGTGSAEPSQFIVRSLGADAQRPVGPGPDDFCFYHVFQVDSGATLELFPVNGATGEALLDEQDDLLLKTINSEDIIAVRFGAGGLNDFGDCPQGEPFEMLDMSSDTIASGRWILTGRPDFSTFALPPGGGVVNAGGPAGDGFAYNHESPTDGNNPYRNILLAEAVQLPVYSAPAAPSRWWVDNIKLERVGGVSPCPCDLTGSGFVGGASLANLLGNWGASPPPPALEACCESAQVGSACLAILLGSWGPCP